MLFWNTNEITRLFNKVFFLLLYLLNDRNIDKKNDSILSFIVSKKSNTLSDEKIKNNMIPKKYIPKKR